jgi:hypothetical protein
VQEENAGAERTFAMGFDTSISETEDEEED